MLTELLDREVSPEAAQFMTNCGGDHGKFARFLPDDSVEFLTDCLAHALKTSRNRLFIGRVLSKLRSAKRVEEEAELDSILVMR